MDFGPGQAEIQTTQDDILVAGTLGVNSQVNVEHRSDAALNNDFPRERLVNSSEHPQQRRLSGTVVPEQRDTVAVADLE